MDFLVNAVLLLRFHVDTNLLISSSAAVLLSHAVCSLASSAELCIRNSSSPSFTTPPEPELLRNTFENLLARPLLELVLTSTLGSKASESMSGEPL